VRVRFTSGARADLSVIGDWIAQDDPTRAVTFTAELVRAAKAISTRVRHYPVAASLAEGEIRKKNHRRYLISYRILGREVHILRIVHGSRDWAALLGEAE
jgi:toxin ParE1/3/4